MYVKIQELSISWASWIQDINAGKLKVWFQMVVDDYWAKDHPC